MIKIILNYILFFIFMIIIKIIINNSNYKNKSKIKKFIQNELQEEFIKTKNIEEDIFYKPDISSLPIKNYNKDDKSEQLINLQENVIKASKNKMLFFDPPLTNKEIKLKYGNNNLKNIVNYEKSYTNYIISLNKWAEKLIQLENYKDAEIILLKAINMKSLIFSSYSLIIEVYIKTKNYEKIKDLKNKIENMSFLNYDAFLKNKLNTYLEKII